MARKARPRVLATNKISFNDVNLEGVKFVVVGDCTAGGSTKREGGKPLLKKQKTHKLVRLAEKKTARLLGIPYEDFVIANEHMDSFFTPVES